MANQNSDAIYKDGLTYADWLDTQIRSGIVYGLNKAKDANRANLVSILTEAQKMIDEILPEREGSGVTCPRCNKVARKAKAILDANGTRLLVHGHCITQKGDVIE